MPSSSYKLRTSRHPFVRVPNPVPVRDVDKYYIRTGPRRAATAAAVDVDKPRRLRSRSSPPTAKATAAPGPVTFVPTLQAMSLARLGGRTGALRASPPDPALRRTVGRIVGHPAYNIIDQPGAFAYVEDQVLTLIYDLARAYRTRGRSSLPAEHREAAQAVLEAYTRPDAPAVPAGLMQALLILDALLGIDGHHRPGPVVAMHILLLYLVYATQWAFLRDRPGALDVYGTDAMLVARGHMDTLAMVHELVFAGRPSPIIRHVEDFLAVGSALRGVLELDINLDAVPSAAVADFLEAFPRRFLTLVARSPTLPTADDVLGALPFRVAEDA